MDALPEALCRDAARLFQRRLKEWLEPTETVEVSGAGSEEEVTIEVALLEPAAGRRIELEVRTRIPDSAPDPEAALDLAFDAADAFLGGWLEGERRERHPIDLQELTWDGKPVGVRFQVRHPALEAEAARLLDEDQAP